MKTLQRLLLPVLFALTASAHAADTAAAACRLDLDALPAFLLENDTGAPDHIARKGQAVFDAALETARAAAAKVTDDEGCVTVLRAYLKTYRPGHLGISNIAPAAGKAGPQRDTTPRFRVLSAQTALLVLPTFADVMGKQVKALMEQHAADIAEHPNLIIDVRGNGGGSDWVYAPVRPLIEANRWREVGAVFLATPANIRSNDATCEVFGTTEECRSAMKRINAVMRAAKPGEYVRMPGQADVDLIEPKAVTAQPRHIAVLIDARCGSSCEEFVLGARQSYKVKLFGQSTGGSLDYSNLRPFMPPSGLRRLMYATSRSLRLPDFAVDTAGIPPDQVLPRPTDDAGREAELMEVQRVIESVR